MTKDGLVVAPDKLVDLATYLRDREGYDYLSMVTSVDWPGYFEVVYYLYGVSRPKDALVLKVRLPDKTDPVVPSLISVWPGADFQEREVYDLMGIRFAGHPNLRRILLWEGFEGHPLRKDYQESYFEEDSKPFKSRHPDGEHLWAEDRVPWKDNVTYPVGWDPDLWTQPEVQYRRIMGVDEEAAMASGIKTERILVNIGPQHPSTHGVFRMVVAIEGENVVGLEPEMGYLHRCHEKIGERNTYIMNMPFTDRLDYISSMSNNLGYVLAVEKLMGLQVPERAEYIRVHHGGVDPDRQPLHRHRLPLQRPGRLLHAGPLRPAGTRADPRPLRVGLGLTHDVQLHALRRRLRRPARGLGGAGAGPGVEPAASGAWRSSRSC